MHAYRFLMRFITLIALLCFVASTTGSVFATNPNTTPDWVIVGPHGGAELSRGLDTGDFNGDGYSDALVGIPGYTVVDNSIVGGAIQLHWGSSTGLSTSSGWLYVSSEGYSNDFGTNVIGSCDINGDGYDDPLVTAEVDQYGKVYLFNGSSTGPGQTAAWTFTDTFFNVRFNNSSCLKDINGDGYDDFALTTNHSDTNGRTDNGRILVFHGGANGPNTSPNIILAGTSDSEWLGYYAVDSGDVNGDGFSDVVVGSPLFNAWGESDRGWVRVYYGSSTGISTTTYTEILGNPGDFVGYGIAAGNVNDDAYADILVKDNTSNGRVRLYLGQSSGLNTTAAWETTDLAFSEANYNYSMLVAGDIDGDGHNDIIITNPGMIYFGGKKTYVYLGTGSLPASTPESWPTSTSTIIGYDTVQNQADFNGDGLNDLLFGYAGYYFYDYNFGRTAAFYGQPEAITGLTISTTSPAHPGSPFHLSLNVSTGSNPTYHCTYYIPEQSLESTGKEADITIDIDVEVTCTAANSLGSQQQTSIIILE